MALTRRRTEAFQVLDSPALIHSEAFTKYTSLTPASLNRFAIVCWILLPILLEELLLLVRQVFALEGKDGQR